MDRTDKVVRLVTDEAHEIQNTGQHTVQTFVKEIILEGYVVVASGHPSKMAWLEDGEDAFTSIPKHDKASNTGSQACSKKSQFLPKKDVSALHDS